MKKLLFGALLLGGLSFGFAKNSVNAATLNSPISEVKKGKSVEKLKFDTKEEAEAFIARCAIEFESLTQEEYLIYDGESWYYVIETEYTYIYIEFDC